MNRFLSCLIALGLAVGISACDKKERMPLPKTGASEVKQQAKEALVFALRVHAEHARSL
jgi:hypothetical protein